MSQRVEMTPAELIKTRKRLGYASQGELARALGVTRQTVSNWEAGACPISAPIIKLLECWGAVQEKQ
jgi:DNA-binding transcriptional regulator YiaG